MALSCMRLLSTTFMVVVVLTISIVSFEFDFWAWNPNSRVAIKNIFADAAPVPRENAAHGAKVISDIDLHQGGEDQSDREALASEQEQVNDEEDIQSPADEARDMIPGDGTNNEPEINSYREDNENTGENVSNTENAEEEVQFDPNIESSDLGEKEGMTVAPGGAANPPPTELWSNSNVNKNTSPTKQEGKPLQNQNTNPSSPGRPKEQSPQQPISRSKRKTRAKTFMVAFMGHSGSTAFTTELRTHSEFLVELLEPLEHGEFQFDTDKALARARELMDRGIAQGKIPGFKIRPYHVSKRPEAWKKFVEEYDTRIVWQYRENIVKQAVGEYRHKFLNDSSVIEGLMAGEEICKSGTGQICKFEIDNFRGLHTLMKEFTRSDELLTESARILSREDQLHIVRYEDYLYNRESTMRDAFDFLGVDFQNTASQRKKASPDSLCEMVTNFQDICDRFLQCQLWRMYLNDEKNNCRCAPRNMKPFDSTFCKREAWFQGN